MRACDFFGHEGAYYRALPAALPDSCTARIRREVPEKWQLLCCKSFYYTVVQPQSDAPFAFAHLAAFERAFPSDTMRAFAQATRADLFIEAARLDTARACLNEALRLCQKHGDRREVGEIKRLLARAHQSQGDFPTAIRLLHETAELQTDVDSLNDLDPYFNIRLDLSRALAANQEYREALAWAARARAYAQNTKNAPGFQILAAANFSQIYLHFDRPDSALLYAKEAMDGHFRHQHFYEIDKTHFALAQAYEASGDCQTALAHYRQATCCISPEAYRRRIFQYDQATADCYACLGRLDSAAIFYQKCLQNPDSAALAGVHAGLAEICQRRGDFRSALQHANESRRLHDVAFNAEKSRIVARLNLQRLEAQKEREMSALTRARDLKERQMLLLLLGVVAGAAALLLLVAQGRARRRFLEKEKELLEAREQLQQQQLAQSLADLEKTQEKLSETAEMLALKNRLIDDLQMQLSEKEPGFGYDADRPSEVPKWEGLRRLKILTNADWEVFLDRFEAMSPGFLSRVKGAFPLLTVAETRLFLLTKICFDAQEIADMLGITVGSIWTSRHRLKKKLSLPDGAELDEFVRRFA